MTSLGGLVGLDRTTVVLRQGCLGFFLRSIVVAWTVGEEIKPPFFVFLWGFLRVQSPTLLQSWGEAFIGDGCVFMRSGVGGLTQR